MRYFLDLSFKGTNYAGWQVQPDQPSIQGELEGVLSQLFNQHIPVTGAGRTDAGVHAHQIFAHFDAPKDLPERPFKALNQMLPPDISVQRIIPVADDAHARYDATARSYRYFIHHQKNPMLYDRSFFFPFEVNRKLMDEATVLLRGEKDFAPLSRHNPDLKHTRCTIQSAYWETLPDTSQLVFHISANRFLHNMVRRIVGALLHIGVEKLSLNDWQQTLNTGAPLPINKTIPPQGLFLWSVQYPYL